MKWYMLSPDKRTTAPSSTPVRTLYLALARRMRVNTGCWPVSSSRMKAAGIGLSAPDAFM
eukprot:CAMPEP_0183352662 /NCGR_PEP_ID=MMETSP0164_2-20130417/29611_1 /TAXON_ID=221442 /ORGANISM="Coccolithus pelagicus ssp braarudi, Strain PLY182g" /LENGTH=59 /DNA_ID=CAMNT_0025525145 /DNA_START=659 /DNA_END=838 /DNA_ORIENTATION=-